MPRRWLGDAVYFPESRRAYAEMLDRGWVDASRALFEKAIELDPGYARAYALLAFALEREWFRDMSGSDSLREESLAMARKAVALDDNDATCHLAIGWAHVNRRSYELAEQHFAKALALNPNQPVVRSDIAQFHICRGEPEKAIEGMMEARRLDPFFTPSWFWGEMGTAQFVAGRYDEAIESMRKSPVLSFGQQAILAASYAKAGEIDLASHCTGDLLRRAPDFSSNSTWPSCRSCAPATPTTWPTACARRGPRNDREAQAVLLAEAVGYLRTTGSEARHTRAACSKLGPPPTRPFKAQARPAGHAKSIEIAAEEKLSRGPAKQRSPA